ncbi:creatininase family protein [Lachnospiraceae bacterium 62-35]
MEVQIKKMTWMEFDARRKKTKTLIVPSGAVEVYGPHLPLGTDIIVAEEIACRVAERTGALVSPWLEAGQSHPLYSFPGTVYCRPETVKAVYRDICKSFIKWGFENFLILNTHRNNAFPLDDLMMDLQDEYNIHCASVPWWQYLPSVTDGIFDTPEPQNHASEAATSVMLYLFPQYVRMDKRMRIQSKADNRYPHIIQYPYYNQLTDYGTIGDALAGTVEKGRLTVEYAVENISAFIKEVLEKREND